jgi:hypothetical protein
LHTYAVETDHRKLAMVRRLGSSTMASTVTFDGASAPGMASAAAVVAGAPPSNKFAQEAPVRRHDGSGLVGNGVRFWVKFARRMAIFIWENSSTRRGRGDDPILSLSQAQTLTDPTKIERR